MDPLFRIVWPIVMKFICWYDIVISGRGEWSAAFASRELRNSTVVVDHRHNGGNLSQAAHYNRHLSINHLYHRSRIGRINYPMPYMDCFNIPRGTKRIPRPYMLMFEMIEIKQNSFFLNFLSDGLVDLW